MDAVKQLIERKRSTLAQDFAGRKYIRRSEIEQREIQRLREEEKKELQEKACKSRVSQTDSDHASSDAASSALAVPSKSAAKSKNAVSEEEKIDDLVLPRTEVIRLLRVLKHPVTLFGEDDDTRLVRLKALLKAGIIDTDTDLMEGQRNDFLTDLAELRKRQKTGLLEVRKDKAKEKDEKDEAMVAGESGEPSGEAGSSVMDNDKDTKKMKSNFDDLSDEDKILVFFKRLLQEWELELENRPEAEQRSSKGKSGVAIFKQCARYIDPLFKMCRKRILPDDICRALLVVVNCCLKRDYMAAMDQYIKLAIGNAPWPIGVTMVGIHERSAREKIYTNSVAHIMNDETTRKYLQSIKRLMTLCQRRYPSVPSKSVEFNSLVNGSDLISLLAEDSRSGTPIVEEKLQLTWIT